MDFMQKSVILSIISIVCSLVTIGLLVAGLLR